MHRQKSFAPMLAVVLIALALGGYVIYQQQNVVYGQILSAFKFLDNNPEGLTCPVNGWQNCMPILSEEAKKGCSKEAVTWYKANCPNFQGIAQ